MCGGCRQLPLLPAAILEKNCYPRLFLLIHHHDENSKIRKFKIRYFGTDSTRCLRRCDLISVRNRRHAARSARYLECPLMYMNLYQDRDAARMPLCARRAALGRMPQRSCSMAPRGKPRSLRSDSMFAFLPWNPGTVGLNLVCVSQLPVYRIVRSPVCMTQ